MKIFQKLSFLILSSSILLSGVGLISLRGNEETQSNLDKVIIAGDNANNHLENAILYSGKIEAKTYHYFLQKKRGIPEVYLEQHKQEILKIQTY